MVCKGAVNLGEQSLCCSWSDHIADHNCTYCFLCEEELKALQRFEVTEMFIASTSQMKTWSARQRRSQILNFLLLKSHLLFSVWSAVWKEFWQFSKLWWSGRWNHVWGGGKTKISCFLICSLNLGIILTLSSKSSSTSSTNSSTWAGSVLAWTFWNLSFEPAPVVIPLSQSFCFSLAFLYKSWPGGSLTTSFSHLSLWALEKVLSVFTPPKIGSFPPLF